LGWVLDPEERKVRLYKPGDEPVGILSSPDKLCSDPVLSCFTLALKPIWEPGF
jgi:Uma2 family endonuclease